MALRLQVSNSLTQLAESFCLDLRERRRGVFQPDYIFTQTEGMNSWLRLQLAAYLGIAANYKFLKPNDLIHLAYRILGGRYVKPLSPESQCWVLFHILSERAFISQFPEVASYYLQAGDERDLKRMALAEKVADLFDQYQIYRPEMISAWNARPLSQLTKDDWQMYLWIRSKALLGDRMPDKTSVGNYILDAIRDPLNQERLRDQLPAAWLFGLSVTTQFHIQLFSEIARFSDVSFYLLNPAPSVYWFEDRSEKQLSFLKKKGWAGSEETTEGNALLTSWGRVIRNTFSLLFENDDLLNAYEDVGSEEVAADCLLHKVQNDIFHNRPDTERSALTAKDIQDGSLSINSCYTPYREVEALYNFLVHLVDKKGERLSPRDMVVMVSDVDAYAPYIRAVFDHAPYRFPYSIADESYTADDTIASALKSVLALNEANFKAETVLQILDSPFIRKRFGLSDMALIRKVVSRAGIRFGIEGSVQDETVFVSWKYGLQRIVYGLCMSGEEEYTGAAGESFYPLDMVEGSASLEVIRFCHFVEILIGSLREREKERDITGWGTYVRSVLNNLIVDAADEPSEDLNLLHEHIENYSSLTGILYEELSYEVFCHGFLRSISSATRSGAFVAGGITFCSLIPMRSIPFKVVCLLGLNFDKFPRREHQTGFNLMERERRKGDRNVKENDKHLFLETLLSAKNYLYLSYIGQSARDNTSIPPSALIDELLDYIQTAWKEKEALRDALVVKHPLHSFSRKYRQAGTQLYTYLDADDRMAEVHLFSSSEREPMKVEEISADGFISFFKHPVKAYYNKVLNVRYEMEEVLLRETEVFEIDSLQRWTLKQQLVFMSPDDKVRLRDRLVKTGVLPLRNMANVKLDQLEEEVMPVRNLVQSLMGDFEEKPYAIAIEFPEENIVLSGTLKNVFGDKLILTCWSKRELKYLMEAYLWYLVARASGLALNLYFISSKNLQAVEARNITQEDAYSLLAELIGLYKRGQQEILPFWPDFNVKPGEVAGYTAEKWLKTVSDKINNYNVPCEDPYILNKFHDGFFRDQAQFTLYQYCASLLLEPLTDLFPDYKNPS